MLHVEQELNKKLREKVGKSGYVIGADTSVTAIKIAKKWNGKKDPNVLFVNADAENFSFKKNLILHVNMHYFSFQMQKKH